jgi:hypothetical protein
MSNKTGRCSRIQSIEYIKFGGGGVFYDTEAEIFPKI